MSASRSTRSHVRPSTSPSRFPVMNPAFQRATHVSSQVASATVMMCRASGTVNAGSRFAMCFGLSTTAAGFQAIFRSPNATRSASLSVVYAFCAALGDTFWMPAIMSRTSSGDSLSSCLLPIAGLICSRTDVS